MKITLHVWKQKNQKSKGQFVTYTLNSISPDSSFLEMLDTLNETLVQEKKEPVAFDHDCREGICGSCSLRINGKSHGPQRGQASCQIHMRQFKDGDEIWIEPFRAKSFPVVRDLIVNRSSLDRVMQAGGYISVKTGSAPEAHSQLVPKDQAHQAFDAAACIGCGACVDACKNASASLFVGAKLLHLSSLPQGQVEEKRRTLSMVQQMDQEGFGACSHTGQCEAVCPKEISLKSIAQMNRKYLKYSLG